MGKDLGGVIFNDYSDEVLEAMQNASLRALERIGSQAEGYAEQIVSTEAYRMEKRFADAVKGLHVYGAKVTDGKAISVLKAKVGAGA